MKANSCSNERPGAVKGLFKDLRHWLDAFKSVCKRNLQLLVSIFQFKYNLSPRDGLAELRHIILYKNSKIR